MEPMSLSEMLKRAPYRTVICADRDPGACLPPYAAVSFVPGRGGPTAEDTAAMLDGLSHARLVGGAFLLLAEDAGTRARAKAILLAALAPNAEGRA